MNTSEFYEITLLPDIAFLFEKAFKTILPCQVFDHLTEPVIY